MTMAGRRQAFSTAEFQARLARVREEMQRRRIDVLLINAPENIYYLTGYQTSGYFAYQALISPRAAAPLLLVRYLERGNVDEYSWLRCRHLERRRRPRRETLRPRARRRRGQRRSASRNAAGS